MFFGVSPTSSDFASCPNGFAFSSAMDAAHKPVSRLCALVLFQNAGVGCQAEVFSAREAFLAWFLLEMNLLSPLITLFPFPALVQ